MSVGDYLDVVALPVALIVCCVILVVGYVIVNTFKR